MEQEEPNPFLLLGLIDLANGDRGICHVFKASDGSIHLESDPPPELRSALDAADADALREFFIARGFLPLATELLVGRLLPRARGRPRSVSHEQLCEQRLKQIKKELRASGQRGRVHKVAMQILENEHRLCHEFAAKQGLSFPVLDADKLSNYLRRSKQPHKK